MYEVKSIENEYDYADVEKDEDQNNIESEYTNADLEQDENVYEDIKDDVPVSTTCIPPVQATKIGK